MKARIIETTNIHAQRIWIVRIGNVSRAYRSKANAKAVKAELDKLLDKFLVC